MNCQRSYCRGGTMGATLAVSLILAAASPAAATVVYETGFEPGEGPGYFVIGNLDGQDNWTAGPAQAIPLIQAATVHSGTQALEIDGTAFSNEGELTPAARRGLTDPTALEPLVTLTVTLRITSDIETKYAVAVCDSDVRTNEIVFKPDFGPGDEDDILVNGVSTGVDWSADVNAWVAVQMDLDFTNELADVYYKGAPIAQDIAFSQPGGLNAVAVLTNDGWWASGSSLFVDNLSVTAIPEPATATLLLIGLGMCAHLRPRASRSK